MQPRHTTSVEAVLRGVLPRHTANAGAVLFGVLPRHTTSVAVSLPRGTNKLKNRHFSQSDLCKATRHARAVDPHVPRRRPAAPGLPRRPCQASSCQASSCHARPCSPSCRRASCFVILKRSCICSLVRWALSDNSLSARDVNRLTLCTVKIVADYPSIASCLVSALTY